MKRYLTLGIVMFVCFIVASCTTTRNPTLNIDLTKESWMQQIPTSSNAWNQGADSWFLTGQPNQTEMADRRAPYTMAISTMSVRVPNFTNIEIKGDFQVEIFGTDDRNSVYIYGPNNVVRQTVVGVKGDTLFVGQVKKSSPLMNRVIVRIGIKRLNNLVSMGCASIEGIRLKSSGLTIKSLGRGNIYLSGNMNLKNVTASGPATVNVFGANTPSLNVTTTGAGNVNIIGNVGIECIEHHGNNNINIIGANSDSLKINADGAGKVAINGHANLKEIHAKGRVCVYLARSESDSINAYIYNDAIVGIAGRTNNIYANTYQSSRFLGRYLCAQNAFVRSSDSSHINVAASSKIFASAVNQSSIYFFGAPSVLSQFISGNGVVMPIWGLDITNGCATRPVPFVPSFKGEMVRHDLKGEGAYVPHYTKNHKTMAYKVNW